MKKIFNLISSLLIILFSFSCSFNILEEKSQGALSFTLPENSFFRAASDEMGPPSEYIIEISSQKGSYKKSATYPAGATIIIDEIPLGKVDITIQGQNLRYGYSGTAQAEIIAKETTAVNIPLSKFLLPIYANSSTGSDTDGNGSMQKPYASINKAVAEIATLGNRGVILIDGTFNEQINSGDFIHISKAPNASKAEIKTGNYSIDNGTFEFIDINFIDSSLTIAGSTTFIIGGGTKFTGTSDIILGDNQKIEISAPLTSENVATLKIRATAPSQILVPVTKSVNIANEYNRFKLSGNEKNKNDISKEGLYIENKELSFSLNNPAPSKTYSYKIKEKGAAEYLFPETPYPNSNPVLISDYYFNVGKTYTLEIYESGTSIPINSADITIEENDSLNKVEFDMNVIYVSSTGDDSNDGSSRTAAFKTLEKAVITAGEGTLIKVYGSVDIQSPATVDKNLTIKGFENATLDSNIDQAILVTNRKTLELEHITVNGNITLGDTGAGNMVMKDGATFNSNNTITVHAGQLQMEGSAKAGKIDLQVSGGLKVIGTLTESNVGTVTVNISPLNDGDSILAADTTEEKTANFSKFTYNISEDTKFEARNDGNIHPVSAANIASVLAKHTTSPAPIDLRVEIINPADFSTASKAITAGSVDVNLEIVTTLDTVKDYAFENCTHLKKVILPTSIKNIGSSAFSNCLSLTEIDLSNVTWLGSSTFSECTSLTSVTDISKISIINSNAFDGCTNLGPVPSLCEGLNKISEFVFRGCENFKITSKKLPENITQIQRYAFVSCSELELDSLPAGLTSIAENAFAGCSKLTLTSSTSPNSTLPAGLNSIGNIAFSGTGLKGALEIPSGITTLDRRQFENCTAITSVTFAPGSQITSLGFKAFGGCTGLQSITIPDTVTNIYGSYYDSAFIDCSSLQSITLPPNLEVLEQYTFKGCNSLTSVSIKTGTKMIYARAFEGIPVDTLNISLDADSTKWGYGLIDADPSTFTYNTSGSAIPNQIKNDLQNRVDNIYVKKGYSPAP